MTITNTGGQTGPRAAVVHVAEWVWINNAIVVKRLEKHYMKSTTDSERESSCIYIMVTHVWGSETLTRLDQTCSQLIVVCVVVNHLLFALLINLNTVCPKPLNMGPRWWCDTLCINSLVWPYSQKEEQTESGGGRDEEGEQSANQSEVGRFLLFTFHQVWRAETLQLDWFSIQGLICVMKEFLSLAKSKDELLQLTFTASPRTKNMTCIHFYVEISGGWSLEIVILAN